MAGVHFMASGAANNNVFFIVFFRAPLKKAHMMFHKKMVSFDSMNDYIFPERPI